MLASLRRTEKKIVIYYTAVRIETQVFFQMRSAPSVEIEKLSGNAYHPENIYVILILNKKATVSRQDWGK